MSDIVEAYQCKCPLVDADTGTCPHDCVYLYKSCLCSECKHSERLEDDIYRQPSWFKRPTPTTT